MLSENFLRTINYLETKNSPRRCAVSPQAMVYDEYVARKHAPSVPFFVVGDGVFLSIVKIGLAVQYFCSF